MIIVIQAWNIEWTLEPGQCSLATNPPLTLEKHTTDTVFIRSTCVWKQMAVLTESFYSTATQWVRQIDSHGYLISLTRKYFWADQFFISWFSQFDQFNHYSNLNQVYIVGVIPLFDLVQNTSSTKAQSIQHWPCARLVESLTFTFSWDQLLRTSLNNTPE